MAPTVDDRVEIDRRAARRNGASPLIFHARHPPEARVVLEEARDDILQALERGGLEPRVRSWVIDPVGSSVHYGGTCRMHASPKYGMIDRFSRLYDVQNVAVADSAAFTTGPEKNPVLTAMALAARASATLAQDIRSGDL
jgi:choline dehydrogenase-like flavoprotein